MSDRVLICAKEHNFDDCVSLAAEYGLGIEVQSFAMPHVLDGDWRGLLGRYRAALKGIGGEIAMHGPFFDMASGSPDPLIDAVVRQRVEQSLHIGAELGAKTVVFHANFIATMRNYDYRASWTERQITFWTPMAERAAASGMVIALENMWEFDPEIIGGVLRRVNHPALQSCVDIGHIYLFSEVPLAEWLNHLSAYIVHVHMNNNGGEVDEHRALENGVLKYSTILPALRALPQHPAFSLEIEQVADIERSLAFLNLS